MTTNNGSDGYLQLRFKYVNGTTDPTYAAASGTMIGGGYVLTAAHAVYYYNAFSIPSQDPSDYNPGNITSIDNPYEYLGAAGRYLSTFSNIIQNTVNHGLSTLPHNVSLPSNWLQQLGNLAAGLVVNGVKVSYDHLIKTNFDLERIDSVAIQPNSNEIFTGYGNDIHEYQGSLSSNRNLPGLAVFLDPKDLNLISSIFPNSTVSIDGATSGVSTGTVSLNTIVGPGSFNRSRK